MARDRKAEVNAAAQAASEAARTLQAAGQAKKSEAPQAPKVEVQADPGAMAKALKNRPSSQAMDEILAKREGVTFFPELVAYLPNGSKLFAKTGVSTRELWNTMQKMLEVGQVAPLTAFIDCSHGNFTTEPMA